MRFLSHFVYLVELWDSVRLQMWNYLERNIISPVQMQNLIMMIVDIISLCHWGTQRPQLACKQSPTRIPSWLPSPGILISSFRSGFPLLSGAIWPLIRYMFIAVPAAGVHPTEKISLLIFRTGLSSQVQYSAPPFLTACRKPSWVILPNSSAQTPSLFHICKMGWKVPHLSELAHRESSFDMSFDRDKSHLNFSKGVWGRNGGPRVTSSPARESAWIPASWIQLPA